MITTTKSSRWSRIRWQGLSLSIVCLLFAGALYAHREWVRSWEVSYSRQCREARDDSRWVDLQRLGEQWTTWDRRNADAWLFRADAAQHQGDFQSAATFLESIPESAAKSLPALVSLATLQFGPLNRPLDGVRTCERMLKLEPRTTAAHHQLIEFYAMSLQRRQLDFHIRFAIQCLREPPSAYVYLFLIDTMRLDAGVELNAKWLTQYPDNDIFQVAHLLQMPEPDSGVRSGSGDDKYSLADALFERFPKNLELLAYKVDLSIRRGNVEEVMELLRGLPPEADEDCRFWRAKGWLHLSRDEVLTAKQALQTAIDIYPMDWNARNWMADALRREGNSVAAEPLQSIVQSARKLREKITGTGTTENVQNEILMEIAQFSRRCGDVQIDDALSRRLGLKQPN